MGSFTNPNRKGYPMPATPTHTAYLILVLGHTLYVPVVDAVYITSSPPGSTTLMGTQTAILLDQAEGVSYEEAHATVLRRALTNPLLTNILPFLVYHLGPVDRDSQNTIYPERYQRGRGLIACLRDAHRDYKEGREGLVSGIKRSIDAVMEFWRNA